FGTTLSSNLVAAGSVGLGSIASDMVSDYFISNSNLPTNIVSTEEMLVRVGVCGLASTGALMAAGADLSSTPTTFLVGAGSKLAGDYVQEQVFGPKGIIGPIF